MLNSSYADENVEMNVSASTKMAEHALSIAGSQVEVIEDSGFVAKSVKKAQTHKDKERKIKKVLQKRRAKKKEENKNYSDTDSSDGTGIIDLK